MSELTNKLSESELNASLNKVIIRLCSETGS